MTSEVRESPLETPHPEGQGSSQADHGAAAPTDLEAVATPPMPPYASTSGDELNVLLTESLNKPAPDPLLGSFSDESPISPRPRWEPLGSTAAPAEAPKGSFDAVVTPEEAAPQSFPHVEDPEKDPHRDDAEPGPDAMPGTAAVHAPAPAATTGGSFDALAAIDTGMPTSRSDEAPLEPASFDAFPASALVEAVVGPSPFSPFPTLSTEPTPSAPASADDFPAIDMSAPPSANPPAGKDEEEDEEDEEDEDDGPSRGSSVLMFLLFSYASAVTLGLVWVLMSGRRLRDSDEGDPFPPADTRADPGRRADQSRKVAPPPPIAADHLAAIGKTVQLGSLEVTPVAIHSGPVRLKRAFGNAETRDGGAQALKLILRLKNVSPDTIYAPLDEAFLRERERDVLDSMIEAGQGAPIAMYPLATSSELTIVGQEFKELRPGESFETAVVSEADSAGRIGTEATWRVRLRTGMDRTDTLGVRFRPNDIRPGK